MRSMDPQDRAELDELMYEAGLDEHGKLDKVPSATTAGEAAKALAVDLAAYLAEPERAA